MGHNGSPERIAVQAQQFSLSVDMATNKIEEFAQNVYALWRTTQQTLKRKFSKNTSN